MSISINVVRKLAWHLNPSMAEAANMTVEQLKQFIGSTFTPSEEQLKQLTRRRRLEAKPVGVPVENYEPPSNVRRLNLYQRTEIADEH